MRIHSKSHSHQSGQTLVETLVAFGILFLTFFAVIEVVRLVSYKTLVQTVLSATTRQIAYTHLDLIKKNRLSDEKFKHQISIKIADDLDAMKSTLLSFDHKEGQEKGILYLNKQDVDIAILFVNQTQATKNRQAGIYIKVTSCLPVLFSSYFQNISKDKLIEIGRKVKNPDQNRTCLGHFSNSKFAPLFWFRVRASSYSPWPAASEIYLKGYAFPKNIYGLENEYRQDVRRGIEELNLAKFFLGSKNDEKIQ